MLLTKLLYTGILILTAFILSMPLLATFSFFSTFAPKGIVLNSDISLKKRNVGISGEVEIVVK